MKPLPPRLLDAAGLTDGQYVLNVASGKVQGLVAAPAGGGGSGITVQDENGEVATGVTQLDFQGAGVTAGAGTGEVIVTVPGASGGGGGGGGFDDPATWTADLGYDAEFNGTGSTPPVGWAWVNQESTTYTERNGWALLDDPTTTAENNFRIIERSIPTQATWTLTAKLGVEVRGVNYAGAQLTIRDAATGKIVSWGPGFNGSWRINLAYWGGAKTSTISHPLLLADTFAPSIPYWRIRCNSATSWDFEFSHNGVIWTKQVMGRNITDHLVSPSHVGFGVWRSGRSVQGAVDWLRVR